MEIKTAWDFVVEHYPKYYSSNEIAENDSFQKIIDGEIDGQAEIMYNKQMSETKILYAGILEQEFFEREVQNHFIALKNESDAKIYERAIEEYILKLNAPEKTYYLLGEDAEREYNENGIEGVLSEYENNELIFETFSFTEGVTKSAELANQMIGWHGYVIIAEEEYLKLNS